MYIPSIYGLDGDNSTKLRFVGEDRNDDMVINIPPSISVTKFQEEINKATIGKYFSY